MRNWPRWWRRCAGAEPEAAAEGEGRGWRRVDPGLYRHYKGRLYDVIGIATHSESGERLVVYRPQYGERALWVRPLACSRKAWWWTG